MSDVGDIAALWRRIDAWPGELKQALKLEAEAQMKVDDLQRQVDEARESRPSAGEYENNSRRESLLALRFGRPTSRAEAEAQRKVDRAAGALEEARHDATRRLVREYEERGQRTPAERNVHALVESEDDVKALREAHQRAKEELEDIEWPRGEQASTPAARRPPDASAGQGGKPGSYGRRGSQASACGWSCPATAGSTGRSTAITRVGVPALVMAASVARYMRPSAAASTSYRAHWPRLWPAALQRLAGKSLS